MRILSRYCVLVILFAFGSMLSCLPAWAQGDTQSLQLSQQKIESGLIYNFLKYTEWPAEKAPESNAASIVCILGSEDPFGGYLEAIEDRTVKQHPIKLRYVSAMKDAAACHLIFISATEMERWSELRTFLAGKHVLTVGDFPGFADEGGMIEFGTKGNHIFIELNAGAIAKAHLVIYSGLRRLSVTTHPPQGKE